MKKLLVLLLLFVVSASFAAKPKEIKDIAQDDLIAETQPTVNESESSVTVIWWIPVEFWEVSFSDDNSLGEKDKKQMLDILDDYSIVAVVQADIGAFGSFDFYSEKEVSNKLKMLYTDGKGKKTKIKPLTKLEPEIELMLKMMKPILASAMGNMGENFHFFVLDDKDNKKNRIIDPYEEGKLEFTINSKTGDKKEAEIQMPLNSLFIPRLCPNGQEAHVSWKYCPWTGKKLED